MQKRIQSALVSVFNKEGIEPLIRLLHRLDVTLYSTGGTQSYIEGLGIPCIPVESVTDYPSILGGRVKTLHPKVFGGILGRRDRKDDAAEMKAYSIPAIDMVVVDLYPFEETVASTNEEDAIVEKIDIGGPSMIRAAAKNFRDLFVVPSRADYADAISLLESQDGGTTIEQRRRFAGRAFSLVAHYDVAIGRYFDPEGSTRFLESLGNPKAMRYGENPHQSGAFFGNLGALFTQLAGKELSYNNLVDVDAAVQLVAEFPEGQGALFAIIKHTNVCGIALRDNPNEAWQAALSADPESAFGGILACNRRIDEATAAAIGDIFFEVLIAPGFTDEALRTLSSRKNRILLQWHGSKRPARMYRSLLNGVLVQETDLGDYERWEESGGRESDPREKDDLRFANIVCKHLKSNAIALVKDRRMIGKGCGQTSRIDALRQALDKARHFGADTKGAVMASDAFFPFDDCVRMGHEAGITAFIQPGGSIRDKDSIDYCRNKGLAMVLTGMRHFRH
jgi:phosphoribosylaminoimidazolecarboxamide formyltransferase/IMP cyclohydrolase